MNEENVVVAVFSRHDQADSAVRALGQANFPLEQLTIVGKGYHTDEKATGFYNTDPGGDAPYSKEVTVSLGGDGKTVPARHPIRSPRRAG